MATEIRIEPVDTDSARSEIERTRERMSRTIDEIERVLVHRRAKLRDRLDFVGRAKQRPFAAVGVALGTGLLLGLLSGGRSRKREELTDRRSVTWEVRTRRLLDIARRQEEEIGELEATVAELSRHLERRSRADHRSGSIAQRNERLEELRAAVADRVDAFAAAATRAVARDRTIR